MYYVQFAKAPNLIARRTQDDAEELFFEEYPDGLLRVDHKWPSGFEAANTCRCVGFSNTEGNGSPVAIISCDPH